MGGTWPRWRSYGGGGGNYGGRGGGSGGGAVMGSLGSFSVGGRVGVLGVSWGGRRVSDIVLPRSPLLSYFN